MSDNLYRKLKKSLKKTNLYPAYRKLRGYKTIENKETITGDVWVFNAGNTFTGNPKWLFLYINNYRKDINPYWICDDAGTIAYVKRLGFQACTFDSSLGKRITGKCHVYVVENVKEHIPNQMRNAVLLNLFHGVGCKSVEKKVNYGFLTERIARKYIKYNEYYHNNQLFLVTSPLMEQHFKEQCGLADDHVIRAGYPRCIYQTYFDKVSTFHHDIRGEKGLSEDTKIAVYAPTYRDGLKNGFFSTAIPDLERLIHHLEKQNMLLIFKLHPFMEKDPEYLQIKELYSSCKYILFWNNKKDIYEIFDQIDLAIVDYSSIFYDLLAAGVPHFIRYFFDYDNKDNLRDFVFDVEEMTCGKMCRDFEELLNALEHFEETDDADRDRLLNLFWEYSSKDSMEEIVNQALTFKPEQESHLPTLYSFDIFDTIFSRKVLKPQGIFYYVKEKMEHSDLEFEDYITQNYPFVRAKAEANVREYYSKTLDIRESERREITFDEIFERMRDLYKMSDAQIDALKNWELEAEYDNVIPLEETIDQIEELMDHGETVILISDMYLPKDFVLKLIRKVSDKIAELPIFLSSDYGVQKTTGKLFIKAYLSFTDYNFKQWKHYGDSRLADAKIPRKLGISCQRYRQPRFKGYENALVEELQTYDAYLVAALMARFRSSTENEKEVFAYSYISTYYVPYVRWCVEDALNRGIECLYFISRDGHFLKEIADVIIQNCKYPIKTHYIYGSRKAWRIPSFIDEIDKEFFLDFGNFSGVTDYEKLLKSLDMSSDTFLTTFPELEYVTTVDYIDLNIRKEIISSVSVSEKYRDYVLEKAENERGIVEDYFRQEINTDEKFAFIEYWGRGYTQECFTRLLQDVAGRELDVPYYYIRSIYPTIGHNIRYNFAAHNQPVLFTEAIFANVPYKSVTHYEYRNHKAVPVIEPVPCDQELYDAMGKCLKLFTSEYIKLPLFDKEGTDRAIFDFSLNYYRDHQDDEIFVNCLAHLEDSVELYGDKKEFAPAFTEENLKLLENGQTLGSITHSLPMSLARSSEKMREKYLNITETINDEKKKKNKNNKSG